MTLPTITALPTAPSRTDPATFAARGDAWVASLATFGTELNALAAAANAGGALSLGRRAISSTDTAIASDSGKVLELTGTFTLSYSACATLGAGWWCIADCRSGTITHDPSSTETIDGLTTGAQYAGFALLVYCDGSALRTIKLRGSRTEVLTGSGNWVAPLGIRVARATTVGGGASGRRDVGTGCGGPAGGTAIRTFACTPGTSYAYVSGAGGTAVSVDSTNGNAGSSSTFDAGGTTITGSGGSAPTGGGNAVALTGGSATSGEINIPGGHGRLTASGGLSMGGDSTHGRGGSRAPGGVVAATGYGSGGAGSANGTASGAGMDGVNIVEY